MRSFEIKRLGTPTSQIDGQDYRPVSITGVAGVKALKGLAHDWRLHLGNRMQQDRPSGFRPICLPRQPALMTKLDIV